MGLQTGDGTHPQTLGMALNNGNHHLIHQVAVHWSPLRRQHQIISHVGTRWLKLVASARLSTTRQPTWRAFCSPRLDVWIGFATTSIAMTRCSRRPGKGPLSSRSSRSSISVALAKPAADREEATRGLFGNRSGIRAEDSLNIRRSAHVKLRLRGDRNGRRALPALLPGWSTGAVKSARLQLSGMRGRPRCGAIIIRWLSLIICHCSSSDIMLRALWSPLLLQLVPVTTPRPLFFEA